MRHAEATEEAAVQFRSRYAALACLAQRGQPTCHVEVRSEESLPALPMPCLEPSRQRRDGAEMGARRDAREPPAILPPAYALTYAHHGAYRFTMP